jgi:outer membrane murein-binding lipoprotein Lpp
VAVKKVWIGSTGPFLYDDSILYIDEDGVISPDNQQAIATDGQVVVQSAPSSPVHVVRKQDLDDALGNIAGLTARVATLESQMAAAYSDIQTLFEGDVFLNQRIDALTTQVAGIMARYTFVPFQMHVGGFTDANMHVAAYGYKEGRNVLLSLPYIDAIGGGYDFIELGGFPAELLTGGISWNPYQAVQVFTQEHGVDWAGCTQSPDVTGYWKFRIHPKVKSYGFPLSTQRVLYGGLLQYTTGA